MFPFVFYSGIYRQCPRQFYLCISRDLCHFCTCSHLFQWAVMWPWRRQPRRPFVFSFSSNRAPPALLCLAFSRPLSSPFSLHPFPLTPPHVPSLTPMIFPFQPSPPLPPAFSPPYFPGSLLNSDFVTTCLPRSASY